MTENLWIGAISTAIGGVTAIVSGWLTVASKRRSDENARWLERQFQLEDLEQANKKALEDANAILQKEIAVEDKYWYDKGLKFAVLQTRIFRARSKEELIKADQDLEEFLEETPEYLWGGNMNFLYFYCNSDFREQHFSLKSEDPRLQRYVKALLDFQLPTGVDIRKRRSNE
jgi:hypothetical protein